MSYIIFLVIMKKTQMCTAQHLNFERNCPLTLLSKIHNNQCDLSAVRDTFI